MTLVILFLAYDFLDQSIRDSFFGAIRRTCCLSDALRFTPRAIEAEPLGSFVTLS